MPGPLWGAGDAGRGAGLRATAAITIPARRTSTPDERRARGRLANPWEECGDGGRADRLAKHGQHNQICGQVFQCPIETGVTEQHGPEREASEEDRQFARRLVQERVEVAEGDRDERPRNERRCTRVRRTARDRAWRADAGLPRSRWRPQCRPGGQAVSSPATRGSRQWPDRWSE